MSYKSAKAQLGMHGTVVCSYCGKVIITCEHCEYCEKRIYYDLCDECEQLEESYHAQI